MVRPGNHQWLGNGQARIGEDTARAEGLGDGRAYKLQKTKIPSRNVDANANPNIEHSSVCKQLKCVAHRGGFAKPPPRKEGGGGKTFSEREVTLMQQCVAPFRENTLTY